MRNEKLIDFLDKKPLYYKEIDYRRIHCAYSLLKDKIKHPRTVHVVGTNGKGSIGRMVAHLAWKSGLSVGHYSSPHIVKFNERIWLNGKESSDEQLEAAHQRLFKILGQEMSDALSYFEYTTLLALEIFEELDIVVLEAGLGGEYDATNISNKELSIITPIGLDHQAFLGESIEEIAATKIRSIQKQVLLAPQPYDETVVVAREITSKRGAKLFESRELAEEMQEKKEALLTIAKERAWGSYLVDNAMVALQALDILGISYKIDNLLSLELFGRFYALTKNIRIDVGHNPLAASAIAQALERKVILIYNSLDDKAYEEVLRILKPKVKRVEIIPIHSQRATTLEAIENALKKVGLSYSYFDGDINKDEEYLVFGSFYVVEAFLKKREHVPK